ncbi:MAG: hypothetical protein JJU32_19840 [Phormidium sp. BM_Day4_Bin.17]|nr:hypothetical protein [Phormidium sp. BM_Day4_Bin.17]UCJ13243.1 MAG: hypothetical protein JWS08_05540 [Phormidium sp. PBR-2020]
MMTLQDIIKSLDYLSDRDQEVLFEILQNRRNHDIKINTITSLRGKYADIPTSSNGFALRKENDIELENKQKWGASQLGE